MLSSSSTPPSSPPLSGSSMSAILAGISPTQSPQPVSTSPEPSPAAKERHIDPALSLELRLRWLEAIVFGVKHDRKGKEKERVHSDQTLIRAAETLQRTLDTIVESNDGLKRFMGRCMFLLLRDSQGSLVTNRRTTCPSPDAFLCAGRTPSRPTSISKYVTRGTERVCRRNGE